MSKVQTTSKVLFAFLLAALVVGFTSSLAWAEPAGSETDGNTDGAWLVADASAVGESDMEAAADGDAAWAILYPDGDLVMQRGDAVDPAKGEPIGKWTGFETEKYEESVPWHSVCNKIWRVVVADKISPVSTANWFKGCSNMESADLAKLDTSSVTNMHAMFYWCRDLESPVLTSFDTSSVTNMSQMFSYCWGMKTLDLSSFDTSKVTDMSEMFSCSYNLKSLDLSNFDTSSVTNMSKMFSCEPFESAYFHYKSSSLEILNLSGWNTSAVTDMSYMFRGCSNLASLNLTSWNTSSVTDMSYMFRGCSNLTSLNLASWNTSAVTDMSRMFLGCSSLTALDISGFDTANVSKKTEMYSNCPSLASITVGESYRFRSTPFPAASADVPYTGEWVRSGDLKPLSEYLRESYGTDVPLPGTWAWEDVNANEKHHYWAILYPDGELVMQRGNALDKSKGEPLGQWYDFDKKPFTRATDVPWYSLRTSIKKVTVADLLAPASTAYWFTGCSNLSSFNLKKLDTSATTSMAAMFSGCKSLSSFDASMLDVSSVRNVSGMFANCTSLVSLDLSPWGQVSITSMDSMFANCTALANLKLCSFDAKNLKSARSVFSGCSSLVNLDLSGLYTEKVEDTAYMFKDCWALTTLNLAHFGATTTDHTFDGCIALSTITLNKKFKFGGDSALPAIPVSFSRPGYWCRVGGTEQFTSAEFVSSYDGATMAGTYKYTAATAPIPIEKLTVSSVYNMNYTGLECRPEPTVMFCGLTLHKDVDYVLTYKDNVNVGTATVTVTGKGSYTGSKSMTFEILTSNLSSCIVAQIPVQTYSGRPIMPKMLVKNGKLNLVEGTDFTVVFSNNVNPGTATAVIRGVGNYSGMRTVTFAIAEKTDATKWVRKYGAEALDTMEKIVDTGWNGATRGTVVLATDAGYWDALTAAGAAGFRTAPVLMTAPSMLSPQTARLLQTLKPVQIVICGGPAVVSESTAKAAAAAAGGATISRFYGETMTDTADEVYKNAAKAAGGTWSTTAFVATSSGYWDALAAAPVAYAQHMPIFLTTSRTALSANTIKTMKEGGIKQVIIVGGAAVVAPEVEAQLKAAGITVADRLWGQTAIDTSIKVAEYGVSRGMMADNMGVATQNGYWDALAGAALCGRFNSVLVLVDQEDSASIKGFVGVHSSQIARGFVFGGGFAVSGKVFEALQIVTR